MKKVLLAAVALICMSVCVASCSKDEEDNKRYGYGVWGSITLTEDVGISEHYFILDYMNAINSAVGQTGKKDDTKVTDACDKVFAKHTADYGGKISGTVQVYRTETDSEKTEVVKDYTY